MTLDQTDILVSIGTGHAYRVYSSGEVKVEYWANVPTQGVEKRRYRRIPTFGMTARRCREEARRLGLRIGAFALLNAAR